MKGEKPKVVIEDVEEESSEKREEIEQASLQEIGVRQEINNAIANVPRKFKVGGKVLEVKSKPIGRMIEIEDRMYEFLGLLAKSDELTSQLADLSVDEQIRQRREVEKKLYELSIDIVFMIVNDDWDKPEVSKEWLWENLDVMGEHSTAKRIMDAFKEMGSPLPFFQAIIESRRF